MAVKNYESHIKNDSLERIEINPKLSYAVNSAAYYLIKIANK